MVTPSTSNEVELVCSSTHDSLFADDGGLKVEESVIYIIREDVLLQYGSGEGFLTHGSQHLQHQTDYQTTYIWRNRNNNTISLLSVYTAQ